MLKLIRADFYKVFRRPSFYILLTVLPLLAVALVLVAIRGRNAGTMTGAFDVAPNLLTYPGALLPLVTELTLGEELRGRTVKNTIEYGTSRAIYFCGKLISAELLGAILLLLVFGAYFGTAFLSLPQGMGVSSELAGTVFSRIGAAFAVYTAACAFSMFLLVVFHRSTLAIFTYYGGIYLTELFLQLFQLNGLKQYLLNTQLSLLTGEDPPRFGFIFTVAAVTFAIFFAGGLTALKRKDMA